MFKAFMFRLIIIYMVLGTVFIAGLIGIGLLLRSDDDEVWTTDNGEQMSQNGTKTFLPLTESTGGKIAIGITLSLVIFLSIFGNVLVCVAVYTDHNLRKIGNLFVVSLAIADLFVASVVMSFALVNDLLGYWPFGMSYCDTWIAFDVMCSTASIVNLCAISLDRYIHIKDPLRYSRWLTKRIVTTSIAVIWVMAALISFLPIYMGLHTNTDSNNGTTHQEDPEHPQCALDLNQTYAVLSSCISFFLPCCLMLAIYSRLYLYAKKHVKSIQAMTRPVTLGALEGETTRPQKVQPMCHVSESKAAKTVGIIVGTFLTCWLPFFCVNIVASYCQSCIPPKFFKALTWLGYSNSVFNPIIYSIFNHEFRHAFRRILTTKIACAPCCRLWCQERPPSYMQGSQNNHKHPQPTKAPLLPRSSYATSETSTSGQNASKGLNGCPPRPE